MERILSRRGLVGGLSVAGLTLGLATPPSIVSAVGRTLGVRSNPRSVQDAPTGPFELPALPYDYAALEPHIDAQTMEIHHDKHHATYVSNLNKAVADLPDLQAKSALELITGLDQLPEEQRGPIRNNAGGHVNHTMYWEIMGPGGGGAPTGPIAEAITRDFGDVTALQEAVNSAGLGRFGSGWSWVVLNEGTLSVLSTPNQDNPVMDGSGTPILGIDVWEHAYYLKYQNKRVDYLTAWWNVINWETVNQRYTAAGGQ